jgi:hypothetical protein
MDQGARSTRDAVIVAAIDAVWGNVGPTSATVCWRKRRL